MIDRILSFALYRPSLIYFIFTLRYRLYCAYRAHRKMQFPPFTSYDDFDIGILNATRYTMTAVDLAEAAKRIRALC
jgi:hypothetical protein